MNLTESERNIVSEALRIIESHFKHDGIEVGHIDLAVDFLRLKLAAKQNEVFSVMFLDAHGRLLEYKELFSGTVDMAIIFPRVILQEVVRTNAVSIIISHNHPSGEFMPGESDMDITKQIIDIMRIVDVKVLDHIVIGGFGYYSFSENGILYGIPKSENQG